METKEKEETIKVEISKLQLVRSAKALLRLVDANEAIIHPNYVLRVNRLLEESKRRALTDEELFGLYRGYVYHLKEKAKVAERIINKAAKAELSRSRLPPAWKRALK